MQNMKILISALAKTVFTIGQNSFVEVDLSSFEVMKSVKIIM